MVMAHSVVQPRSLHAAESRSADASHAEVTAHVETSEVESADAWTSEDDRQVRVCQG